jgi:hypothetical protein
MKRNLHSLSANSLEFLQFANWHDVFENWSRKQRLKKLLNCKDIKHNAME